MLAQVTYPSTALSDRRSSWMQEFVLIGMGSLLIALCAPLSIKLPFSQIPLAIAPHLCLALGVVLGKKRGALAVLAYLIQGGLGLPVFALGKSGILHLLGPGGGYLFGYVAGTYLTGYLMEKCRESTPLKTLLALAAGNGTIYLFGATQLGFFIGWKLSVLSGVLPFLIGDAIKCLLLSKRVRRLA